MKPGFLWQISVSASSEAEEAVAAWMETTFGQPASVYTEAATRRTTVTVCLERKPDWSPARRMALRASLGRLRECGLNLGPGRLRLKPLARQNWAESWKRHFRPLEFGGALLLRPTWSRRRARPGQAEVVLDPGLSFGTGRHPTTGFCLRQLVARRRSGSAQSFLDLGTGTGILAIAAVQLGYAPVLAMDFDAAAVSTARANARLNGVGRRLRLCCQNVAQLPRRAADKYSVVCANLTADLLLAERDRIVARVARGGALVLAGILQEEFAGIRGAYEATGMKWAAGRTEKEWRSGVWLRS